MNIGNLKFDRPIALAPMEDVTDTSFRLICKRFGADIVYTEFTSSEAIIRDVPRALSKITVSPDERPIAIQIFGGVEESMELAARRAQELGPDFIDINCGCWVKSHVARGEGAALLKDLKKFERIVMSTVKGTSLPVTVKTRLGWDPNSIVILDVARMLEQSGVRALTVHFRTRNQAHNKTPADWTWIEKLKKATKLPLIGNGDVRSPQDVKQMFDLGCDGVMIGRAAIGNPWIFKQSRHFLEHGHLLPEPTLTERIDVCIAHLKLMIKHKGVRNGVIPFRKYYAGYLKGVPHVSQLRSDLMQLIEPRMIYDRLHRFLDQNAAMAHSPQACSHT